MTKRIEPACTKGTRHWFAYYGLPGTSSPTCVRCGIPNPKYEAARDPLAKHNPAEAGTA